MNLITIDYEFGSGGSELGKILSEKLGYEFYDNEIISAISQRSGMDEQYITNKLQSHEWKNVVAYPRRSMYFSNYINTSDIRLLTEQNSVLEEIAKRNKNCIIIGRNADIVLAKYKPFSVFVCATTESKLERYKECGSLETQSKKARIRKMKHIDKVRAQTRMMMSGADWGNRAFYHLTVNTSERSFEDIASAMAEFIKTWFRKK